MTYLQNLNIFVPPTCFIDLQFVKVILVILVTVVKETEPSIVFAFHHLFEISSIFRNIASHLVNYSLQIRWRDVDGGIAHLNRGFWIGRCFLWRWGIKGREGRRRSGGHGGRRRNSRSYELGRRGHRLDL